jgi:hypothetical protein
MTKGFSNLLAHGVLILLFALLAPRLGMPTVAVLCTVIAASVIALLGELEDRQR